MLKRQSSFVVYVVCSPVRNDQWTITRGQGGGGGQWLKTPALYDQSHRDYAKLSFKNVLRFGNMLTFCLRSTEPNVECICKKV